MCIVCKCGSQSGNERITITIKGIKTSSCAKTIEKTLLGMPGILYVHVHAYDGQTKIDYNPTRTTLEGIAHKLESVGYHVQVNKEDRSRKTQCS